MSILLVALGGSLGAVVRYLTASWLTTSSQTPALPWGTIAVNLIGCFAIGVLFGFGQAREGLSEPTRMLAAVGFLGGFTTYSAFGLETVSLFQMGSPNLAGVNVGLQLVGGLAGVALGLSFGTFLART